MLTLAALILFGSDYLSKKFGGKNVFIFIFCVIPFIAGAVYVYLNFDSLLWWQAAFYPFLGVALMLGILLLAMCHVIPDVIFELILGFYERFKSKNKL